MEDVIVYVVIAASIVASIFNNYQKQKKANEKRQVNKPAADDFFPPVQKPAKPAARPKQPAAPVTAGTKYAPAKSEIESTIEKYQFGNYESLEYSGTSISSMSISDFETPEGFEEEPSIEEQEKADERLAQKSAIRLFENKDELKKAVLYKEILERKY